MQTDTQFSIKAKTCTLLCNNINGNSSLLDKEIKYIIPIYQRPYSWTEKEIKPFILDLFRTFWDDNGILLNEPMFIGTIQLTKCNDKNEQEVIDGQQRLTTLLLLIRILKIKYPDSTELEAIAIDWLDTKVNNGIQKNNLDTFLSSDLSDYEGSQNYYIQNAKFIIELFSEQIIVENIELLNFDIKEFVNHLVHNLYFVVIETNAGLSKTLQIFKAINTTGLDLNGGDIFKIKMFEYLKEKVGKDDSAFDEISRLYQLIDLSNSKYDYKFIDIRDVLSIYQHILVAKYNLPTTLYGLSSDTFFERLFDTMFGIIQWEHFKNNIQQVVLSIEDLENIIVVRSEWESDWKETGECMCNYRLIEHSRYAKFVDLLPVIFRYNNRNFNQAALIKQLFKLYFIYSVRFQKSIYEIQNWTYSLIKEIISGASEETILEYIKNKIGNAQLHNTGYNYLDKLLKENLTENAKRKKLICLFSAMLDEKYITSDRAQIDLLEKNLFKEYIDIEHIQSLNDIDGDKRESIENEWGDNINSIGNLMILEFNINRSIKNESYDFKIERYTESKYSIVHNQVQLYSNWTLYDCKTRENDEYLKIISYIFN